MFTQFVCSRHRNLSAKTIMLNTLRLQCMYQSGSKIPLEAPKRSESNDDTRVTGVTNPRRFHPRRNARPLSQPAHVALNAPELHTGVPSRLAPAPGPPGAPGSYTDDRSNRAPSITPEPPACARAPGEHPCPGDAPRSATK